MAWREQLDFYFPFIVLTYGILISLVLTIPGMLDLGPRWIPEAALERLEKSRLFAFVCLVVGGLWSLQNIWFSPY